MILGTRASVCARSSAAVQDEPPRRFFMLFPLITATCKAIVQTGPAREQRRHAGSKPGGGRKVCHVRTSARPRCPLSGTLQGFLDSLCPLLPAATDYAILGFDPHLHCCYASGSALGTLGIENPLRGTELQALAPALRTVVSGLCRCVFAGALTETGITLGPQRLRLTGMPLLDSSGAISMALIRILPVDPLPDDRTSAVEDVRNRSPDGTADWHDPERRRSTPAGR
ncbi:MAG TPA: hypothetical protein PLP98_07060 [Plasticicumulans sp.]|nr:hypothetical protein [Plasticicumulans sp.]